MRVSAFIEPCLPSPADRPPSGPDWIQFVETKKEKRKTRAEKQSSDLFVFVGRGVGRIEKA
jgi:hypothetical protein